MVDKYVTLLKIYETEKKRNVPVIKKRKKFTNEKIN